MADKRRQKLKMEQNGTLFAWPVSPVYRWVSDYQADDPIHYTGDEEVIYGIDDTPPWLMDFGGPRWSTPLVMPTLHRKFGELKTEEGSIITFANRYGLLGKRVVLCQNVKDSRSGQVVSVRDVGESLLRWKHEIKTMAVWLGIWDLIRQRNTGKLGEIVIWSKPHGKKPNYIPKGDHFIELVSLDVAIRRVNDTYEVYRPKGDEHFGFDRFFARIADRYDPQGEADVLLKRWRRGDVIKPAQNALYNAINEKLKGQLYVQLAWPHFESVEPFMVPKSLLAAMWLMFMWEVSGARDFFRCEICGEWKERFKADQKTCSEACRQRKHRNQKRQGAHNE